ncbi:LamG-like jellyroll fold domain-containing protein [Polaribacter filamentus]|nr:LamG-like jellyroll fold domain-containing protein [Polaribacter filamentus]
MKYHSILLCSLLSFGGLMAQEKLGVKTVISAGATAKDSLNHTITTPVNGVNKSVTINTVQMQIGLPYMGVIDAPFANNPSEQNYIKDLGFPWGIRYRSFTFSDDYFSVSKGYYSDKIEINWTIKANQDKITSFEIYRTEDVESIAPNWGTYLKNLGKEEKSFEDKNIEGGKLYRYKLVAIGVEATGVEIEYTTFIAGIGYRNPTGIVAGTISFSGGTPVANALVTANPAGGNVNFGSSLRVPGNSNLLISKLRNSLTNSITLQAWVKPETNIVGDSLEIYKIYSSLNENLSFNIEMEDTNGVNKLYANIGNFQLTLTDFIPSGSIDNKGLDILIPITDLNTSFTHFSAVLKDGEIPKFYINGRLITAEYAVTMNTLLSENNSTLDRSVEFSTNNNTVTLSTSSTGLSQKWNYISAGGGKTAYIDELRVWETALSENQIKTDYRRYIRGNETFLNTYIRANEGKGNYAYDLAHTGYVFHGNNAKLSNVVPVTWANDAENRPTNQQLGILGITDEFGNYVISSIPYGGNGETFTIVPSLGVHDFSPSQQLAFIGANSMVINKVDFIDTSSFSFKGNVVYDSRGVFPAIAEAPIKGDIKEDEAYNAYTIGNLKYQKGEYWAEKDATGKITELRRYAKIPVQNAQIFIDKIQAIDSNNNQILTGADGQFTIEVPIGKHAISIGKALHTFDFDGRYPANQTDTINGEISVTNTYVDFFEDRNEPITFINNTKIIAVGRVVGGQIETAKPIGFGFDGTKTYNYTDDEGIDRSIEYTSKNNMGVANITLGYMPTGSASITPEYETTFTTNGETGEFRVSLLPLSYTLEKSNLTFKSGNPDSKIELLDENKTINFTTINPLIYPSFRLKEVTIKGDDPYQEVLSFTHMATPNHEVINQTSETSVEVNGNNYQIAVDQDPLIYLQFQNYSIKIKSTEIYENYDSGNPVIDEVPVTDAQLIVTNNMALEDSEAVEQSADEAGVIVYTFRGGSVNTSSNDNYTSSLDLKINDSPISGYIPRGIVLGGVSDGSQTFVTAGPEKADIILRDPPGSNSSATIEKGSSFSFTVTADVGVSLGNESTMNLQLGNTFEVGGGLAGPVSEVETTSTLTSSLSTSVSSNLGVELSTNYTFNQAISTSDDPNWVGSSADLYIGSSTNQYYGTYNDLSLNVTSAGNPFFINAINIDNDSIKLYPEVKKAMYFSESPEKTFFIYSQYQIISEIIPKYESIIEQIHNGDLVENVDGIKTVSFYNSSINLWRQVILNNEKEKYQALNDKDALKNGLTEIINALPGTSLEGITDLLNASFYENISFDAGSGGLTKSYESVVLNKASLSVAYEIESSVAYELGLTWNDTGATASTKATTSINYSASVEASSENTSNISYTLRDNDSYNLFSIDVINAFDGNGPIFSTIGGETSCPYESAEQSFFYNPDHANVTDKTTDIIELPDTDRVTLSNATVPLEVPEVTVEVKSVTNIPEGRNAEFVLKLSNNSPLDHDALFNLKIDQSTNPNGAKFNLPANGQDILIPSGESVNFLLTLSKVKEDQFIYTDIRITLESACNGDINASALRATGDIALGHVLVSATFVPACSPIAIKAPQNNWLFNKNEAFSEDNTTIPLSITISEYNLDFGGLKKINLQYRLKGTPNWTGLKTYYKDSTDAEYIAATANNDTNVELINTRSEINYSWDIAYLKMSNGIYELRALTVCSNGTGYVSDIIEGTVDLTSPELFGTPTPTNGILNLGDDISLRFNESIKTNGNVSKFLFQVQDNQLLVNHDVSLAFNGASNAGTINKPAISDGNFSIEFWLKNSNTSGASTLLYQENGISIGLKNNIMEYTIGGETISAVISTLGEFNHYALSYDDENKTLTIIENDALLKNKTTNANLVFTNSKSIVIGGNTFTGNIHDLRFWKRYITASDATANMNSTLNGNETNLLGYWPMNEGRGLLAKDIVRMKHLSFSNANWDIKPKGNSYVFDGTNYLDFKKVSSVVISKEMDATLSFWMKTAQTTSSTLLSNGRGDGTDIPGSSGNRDNWAINLNGNHLEFLSEGNTYTFGDITVNDDSWHYITLIIKRNATARMFVDGNEVGSYESSNIGGFSAANLYLGARGYLQNDSTTAIDNYYSGFIDELCIWNAARTADQIRADQYFEMDFESVGLLLYSTFNLPEQANSNGPKYFYPENAFNKVSDYASSNKAYTFSEITPAIKPFRTTKTIPLKPVISGQEIILEPQISNWASIEGKVANITVSHLNDMSDNAQVSPVTWSVLIQRNPVKWFVAGENDNILNLIKRTNESKTFEISIVNRGVENETYKIDMPDWLNITESSGTLSPNSTVTLQAKVIDEIEVGDYHAVLSLTTSYDFNEQIHLDLRVLVDEQEFTIDPAMFSESMTVIGKLKFDGVLSEDPYDRVVAFIDSEIRGIAPLVLDTDFDEYFVFLSVYSNSNQEAVNEQVIFYIWDASVGKLKLATIDNLAYRDFSSDEIIGSYTNPVIFNGTIITGQQIPLNRGWTWLSFNVDDVRFSNLNELTKALIPSNGDMIKSNAPSLYDIYTLDNNDPSHNGWFGSITNNGGVMSNKMYKIKQSVSQNLNIQGVPVDLDTWSFNLSENWNWLPYVVARNTKIDEALANLDAKEGDFIKSQSEFAMYNPSIGWKGSLTYLEAGNGYMLKTSTSQNFTYPAYLNQVGSKSSTKIKGNQSSLDPNNLPYQYAQFANTMSAIVKLPDGFENLYLYNGDGELRGFATTQNVNDIPLAFITIYGNEPGKLTAFIGSENDKKITTTSFNFASDAILGSISKPIVINLLEDSINVSPNPFRSNFEITINTEDKDQANLIITNMLGQIVYTRGFQMQPGNNVLTINPDIAHGTYILKITMTNKVVSKK